MNEFDCVEVIVENEKYARDGIHKGMQGWICCDECIDASWLVSFPQYGEKSNIATIGIKEKDMILIPEMDARVNERLKAQFDDAGSSAKAMPGKSDDLSGYLI